MDLPMPDLPEEIVANILTRLPVKSLLRFRCVSNPWRNLISCCNFAKLHLKRTSEHNADIDHHTLLISSSSRFLSMNFNPSESYSYNELKLDFPILGPVREIIVFGTCNGLIFLNVGFFDQILWNPSTRDYKVLPQPWLGHRTSFTFGGVGFDASIDDYKVVVGSFDMGSNSNKIEVYTLKNGSWRRVQLQYIITRRVISAVGIFANGALHWRLLRFFKEQDDAILSFDLAQEQFRELLLLPPDIGQNHKQCWPYELGVSRGCLSVCVQENDKHIEVWVMKEHGVHSSWSRLFSISCGTIYDDRYFLRPLCILKNDEVLVKDETKLWRYSVKDNAFRLIRDGREWFEAIVYEESLVSLQ